MDKADKARAIHDCKQERDRIAFAIRRLEGGEGNERYLRSKLGIVQAELEALTRPAEPDGEQFDLLSTWKADGVRAYRRGGL